MVAVIDYGVGNLRAIQNIIRKVGGQAIVTNSREEIETAAKLILPGVGAFSYGMNRLRETALIDVLNEQVINRKKIVLGLCLGAQIMTEHSEEGDVAGLGWVPAKTVKFNSGLVKIIPHMGWADVLTVKENPLTKDIDKPRFYFTHSYHFAFGDTTPVTGSAHYGYTFPCSFQLENIYGIQFHPEKSHRFGMKLFENFLKL